LQGLPQRFDLLSQSHTPLLVGLDSLSDVIHRYPHLDDAADDIGGHAAAGGELD